MIVSFSIENWMSFRDPVSFSMIATRERQHGNRVPRIKKYRTRILPVAAIYGGNASGKTNFFKALEFVRNLVVEGTGTDKLIPVEPYRLSNESLEKPSRFSLELLVEETIYEFSFAATRKVITEEKLVQITSTTEKTLYDRQGDKPNFDNSLDSMFLRFVFQGTRDNQLFLTNSVSQKVDVFRPVYDWFRDSLRLIAPDSLFLYFWRLLEEGHPLHAAFNEMLPQLDTGISRLDGEEVSFDSLPFEEKHKKKLQEEVKEDSLVEISTNRNERFVFTRERGRLVARKMFSFHPKADGTEARFEIRQESAGTQRIIDLLPVFAESQAKTRTVYVLDELDRSLHTLLTRKLLETYLDSCGPESRDQLLFTAHDALLMNQYLFRRDEMRVVERNSEGCSDVFSLSEYEGIRYDKDIRKSYLQGRLGGIPRFL